MDEAAKADPGLEQHRLHTTVVWCASFPFSISVSLKILILHRVI